MGLVLEEDEAEDEAEDEFAFLRYMSKERREDWSTHAVLEELLNT